MPRLSPLGHAHLNCLGRYATASFDPTQGLRALGQIPDLPDPEGAEAGTGPDRKVRVPRLCSGSVQSHPGARRSGQQGHAQYQTCSLARVLDRQGSLVGVGDLAADGQAEAGAFRIAGA